MWIDQNEPKQQPNKPEERPKKRRKARKARGCGATKERPRKRNKGGEKARLCMNYSVCLKLEHM